MNKPDIKGGIDIAMKVPSHQYQQTIDFYRNVIGLPEIIDKPPAVGFELGSNRLWIDEAPRLSQAELWLELFTPNFSAAEQYVEHNGFKGGWIMNPCNIVHMLREPEAW